MSYDDSMSNEAKRARIEALIVGKRVVEIRWATGDCYADSLPYPVVDYLVLDDGVEVSPDGSSDFPTLYVWPTEHEGEEGGR